jgi:hypothetical protein
MFNMLEALLKLPLTPVMAMDCVRHGMGSRCGNVKPLMNIRTACIVLLHVALPQF